MSTSVERIRQKAKESREAFISNRTTIEKDIEAFNTNIKKADQSLIAHIEIPEGGLTARSLFPSLYEDKLDLKKYEEEAKAFIQLLEQFDKVRDDLIAKAEVMVSGPDKL